MSSEELIGVISSTNMKRGPLQRGYTLVITRDRIYGAQFNLLSSNCAVYLGSDPNRNDSDSNKARKIADKVMEKHDFAFSKDVINKIGLLPLQYIGSYLMFETNETNVKIFLKNDAFHNQKMHPDEYNALISSFLEFAPHSFYNDKNRKLVSADIENVRESGIAEQTPEDTFNNKSQFDTVNQEILECSKNGPQKTTFGKEGHPVYIARPWILILDVTYLLLATLLITYSIGEFSTPRISMQINLSNAIFLTPIVIFWAYSAKYIWSLVSSGTFRFYNDHFSTSRFGRIKDHTFDEIEFVEPIYWVLNKGEVTGRIIGIKLKLKSEKKSRHIAWNPKDSKSQESLYQWLPTKIARSK
jgi:hypothetical protein